jgi:chromosome segregation ATPase
VQSGRDKLQGAAKLANAQAKELKDRAVAAEEAAEKLKGRVAELEAAVRTATDGAAGEVEAICQRLRAAEGAAEENARKCEALEAEVRAAQERFASAEVEAGQRLDAAVEAVKGQAKKAVEKLKEEKRAAIAAAEEAAAVRTSELAVASARVGELDAALESGKSELNMLRQKCAEQESELRMRSEGADKLRSELNAMRECEAG